MTERDLSAGVEVAMHAVPASIVVVCGGRMVPFLPLEGVLDAEAETGRLRAENEKLKADVTRSVRRSVDRDSEIRRLSRAMHEAHAKLTPGMRVGTAEAKDILARALLQGMAETGPTSDENGETA